MHVKRSSLSAGCQVRWLVNLIQCGEVVVNHDWQAGYTALQQHTAGCLVIVSRGQPAECLIRMSCSNFRVDMTFYVRQAHTGIVRSRNLPSSFKILNSRYNCPTKVLRNHLMSL